MYSLYSNLNIGYFSRQFDKVFHWPPRWPPFLLVSLLQVGHTQLTRVIDQSHHPRLWFWHHEHSSFSFFCLQGFTNVIIFCSKDYLTRIIFFYLGLSSLLLSSDMCIYMMLPKTLTCERSSFLVKYFSRGIMLLCLTTPNCCVSQVETTEVLDQEEEDFKADKNMNRLKERERIPPNYILLPILYGDGRG